MNFRTFAYLRSTKTPARHTNPAAPECFYRTESKKQRTAKKRAVSRRALRALKYAPAVLCLFAGIGHSQALPDAPKPHVITLQRALYATDLGLRIVDIETTHQFLNDPCKCFRELDPLSPSDKGWSHITAFQLGMFSALTLSSEWLRRHKHPRWAIAVTLADIASESWAAQNNLRLKSPKPYAHGQPLHY